MMPGCPATSVMRTDAPMSSISASALTVCSSCTRFMSISTGGATMPRRMLTTRSVPPPSGMLSGLAARAASASASVAGLSTRNSGRASIIHLSWPGSSRPSRLGGQARCHPYRDARDKLGHDGGEAEARAWSCAASPLLQRALALLDRLEHAVGGHRQIVEADADGVG